MSVGVYSHLFARSGFLSNAKLCGQSEDDKKHREAEFVAWITGSWVWEAIGAYRNLLRAWCQRHYPPSEPREKAFTAWLQGVGQLWLRYIFKFGDSSQQFLRRFAQEPFSNWADVVHHVCQQVIRTHARCPQCVDLEFTWPIVKSVRADPSLVPVLVRFVRLLFQTLPFSSDVVECKHAYLQRSWGRRLGKRISRERTVPEFLISSLVRSHEDRE